MQPPNSNLLKSEDPSENRVRNVLVIAYYFPPMGLSGVQRTLKFVKYLPAYGWRPIVVTATAPFYAMDDSLLSEIEPLIEEGQIEVHRTENSGNPAGWLAQRNGKALKLPRASYQRLRAKAIQVFLQPDLRIRWKKAALELIDKIYAEHEIDAVFATAPPFTDFLIARDVRKKYGTPYLMDYRDSWVGNPVLNFYLTPFHRAYAAKLEDSALRSSDAVTVVNRKMKELLLSNYNFLTHEDVSIIAHGYDQEDFDRAAPFAERLLSPGKFRITYSGAFYSGRSPKAFLEGAAIAIEREPKLAEVLELMFVGVLQKEYERLIRKMGLSSNVVVKGYVSHRESVALVITSDLLWMTMSDDISSPGKMYEYIGSKKPILGLVPRRSQAERFLEEYGGAMCVEPDDANAIADAILLAYSRRDLPNLGFAASETFVRGFDRKLLAGELARRLSHIVSAD